MSDSTDARADAARRWALAQLDLRTANFQPASADASFRRYFRISAGARSWIVMDAPPQQEDCRPFLKVAALMADAGLRVPEVLAQDLTCGYLLLSDLGHRTCLEVVDADNADSIYTAAIDTLVMWQKASRGGVLPEFGTALLERELALFPEWYLKRHLDIVLDAASKRGWQRVVSVLVTNALAQPQVYVHRDFMLRNLMPGDPLPAAGSEPMLGVLDFQDAVYGPVAYDPICLFKDAFLSWPEDRVQAWLTRYRQRATEAGIPVPPPARFMRDCDWMGLQRHLKVLGIFARLTHRDGKAKYAADTPRFVRYVMAVAPRYPELSPLVELFERHVLPNAKAL